MLAIAPAVPVKLAEVFPEAMMTEGGTTSVALLLERVTTAPALGAAFDKATVQVVVAPEPILAGAQEMALTNTWVTREMVAVCELPLYAAVMVAV